MNNYLESLYDILPMKVNLVHECLNASRRKIGGSCSLSLWGCIAVRGLWSICQSTI